MIVLSLPIDPEILNRQMQAVADVLGGVVLIPNYRLVFIVPSGSSIVVDFLLPEGYVCTRRSPLRFESNYYDVNITVDVYCDDKKVNPFPLPLTHPIDVDFGQYYVKRRNVRIVLKNATAVDCQVTITVTPNIISTDLYERFYKPIMHESFRALQFLTRGRA